MLGMLLSLLLAPSVLGAIANPLPAPKEMVWAGSGPIHIDIPNLTLQADIGLQQEIVETAFSRARDSIAGLLWFPAAIEKPIASYEAFPNTKREGAIDSVFLHIENSSADLQLGVSEAYTLSVKAGNITISADTIWGALHAFTTLQQLVLYHNGFFIESEVQIHDEPMYPHRGVMIDSGRNFLSLDVIKAQIDIMALCKMNVLHWHIEDAQSWPILLKSYPEMAKDAYSARETYRIEDLKMIISYGRSRGVRIVPELEAPGHANAGWGRINSSLLACGNSWWSNDVWEYHTAVEPQAGQLEILNDDLYGVLETIYDELSLVFSDNVFHVGADELQKNCYNFSQITQEWFQANTSRTYKDLTQYFFDRALPIYNNTANRRLTMWEDVVTTPEGAHHIPKDVIMQSWNNEMDNVKKLVKMGYDVIVSSASRLYLDCGYGGWVTNDPRYAGVPENEEFLTGQGGSWCAPYKTWQTIYDYDFTEGLTKEEKNHILGAEAAMWSEQVDSVVLIPKIWPRTAALAESTWSGNRDSTGMLRTTQLTQRILNFREWLVAMGYAASPLVPQFCVQNPHACDLYHNQSIYAAYSN